MAMTCLRCGAETDGSRALCDKCFAEKQAAPKPEEVLLKKHEPVTVRMMFKDTRVFILSVVCSLIILFGAYMLLVPKLVIYRLPLVSMPSTAAYQNLDPCEYRDRCLVVFVKAADGEGLQGARTMAQAMMPVQRVGFQVIVGGDAPENLSASALTIGGTIFLDNTGEFEKKADPGKSPYWWLLDPQRKILANFSAVPAAGASNADTLQKFINDHFPAEAGTFQ